MNAATVNRTNSFFFKMMSRLMDESGELYYNRDHNTAQRGNDTDSFAVSVSLPQAAAKMTLKLSL
jgi:hypothetical protein